MYRAGPFLKGTPEQGYQLALTPHQFFVAGIAAANTWCEKTYGKTFDRLEQPKRDEALKAMAAALAGTVRDVDTPGVLGRTPPQLLAILPDTDVAGTAHAANRVLEAVNEALKPQGGEAAVGLVCVRPGQRVRAGAVIESAGRSLRSGRPEMMGKPA